MDKSPFLDDFFATGFDCLAKLIPFDLAAIWELKEPYLAVRATHGKKSRPELLNHKISEHFSSLLSSKSGYDYIGGYKIEDELGSGTSGIVFLATKNGSRFALKILKNSTVPGPRRTRLLERFMREAKVNASIEHANVVKLHDYGLASKEEIPFIVMEYLEGCTMQDLIKENAINGYTGKIQILRQVASALSCLHQKGICHRDIKPANIHIDHSQHVKLLDFGLVRTQDSQLTMTNELMGTPLYMAPESFSSSSPLRSSSSLRRQSLRIRSRTASSAERSLLTTFAGAICTLAANCCSSPEGSS